MAQKQYIDQFVWIRILACACIIVLHALITSNILFTETMTPGEVVWSRMMQNQLMWAMPCFLMITGVLLLDPNRQLPMEKLFGKYLRRILLALVCFTLLFRILDHMMGEEGPILTGWLMDLVSGDSWMHLWYLYLMIGIYLMMPFYRIVAEKADEKMMDYLLLVLLVFTSIFPAIEALGVNIGFYIPTVLVYPLYVFAGYRLYHRPLHPGVAAALLVVCTLLILWLSWARYGTDTFANWSDPEKQLGGLFSYSSILVIGQAIGVFSLMLRVKTPAGIVARSFDECTFGIYLMHMIGIRVMMKWWEFDPYWYGPFTFILMAAVLFLLCYGVTWLIRKIPKLNLL